MRKTLFAASLAVTGGLAFAAPAEAQRYPQVYDNNRGMMTVDMSRSCRVMFDYRGERLNSSRRCTNRQIDEARWLAGQQRRGNDYRYGNRYDDRYDRYDRYDRNNYNTRDYDRRGDYAYGFAPNSVMGERDGTAYEMMRRGGFTQVDRYTQGNRQITIWWNGRNGKCIGVNSRKGKVRSVAPAPRAQCLRRY